MFFFYNLYSRNRLMRLDASCGKLLYIFVYAFRHLRHFTTLALVCIWQKKKNNNNNKNAKNGTCILNARNGICSITVLVIGEYFN